MKALLLIASWLFCTSILHTTPLIATGISGETMPIDTSVSRDFTIYEHMECQLLKEWHYKGEDAGGLSNSRFRRLELLLTSKQINLL